MVNAVFLFFSFLSLLGCVDDDSHRLVVLSVLYHISVSEKGRSMFAYTDCIPQVKEYTSFLANKKYIHCI